jgi:hypothetical protein
MQGNDPKTAERLIALEAAAAAEGQAQGGAMQQVDQPVHAQAGQQPQPAVAAAQPQPTVAAAQLPEVMPTYEELLALYSAASAEDGVPLPPVLQPPQELPAPPPQGDASLSEYLASDAWLAHSQALAPHFAGMNLVPSSLISFLDAMNATASPEVLAAVERQQQQAAANAAAKGASGSGSGP